LRPKIQQRVDYILDACRNKKVLHVGCADVPLTQKRLDDGTLLHGMIEKVAAVQCGIDLSSEGVGILRERGYRNLAVADVEELARRNPFGDVNFDVIVAGEILEHLSNPGSFLEGLKPLLRDPASRLILTTVNAYCAYRFVNSLLTGRERVHPDHVCYFSRSTLVRLLTRHGFEVEGFAFYPVGREHERYLNTGRTRILWWADRFAYRFNPALADGVMATCRLGAA
jgi:predicted TPR repeat methyltransferase